ncbi:ABC transporter substrate-binding protein [Microbacterium sufflavum]
MRSTRIITAAALAAGMLIAVSGCAKPLDDGGGAAANGKGTEQVVESSSEATCVNPNPSDKKLSELKIGFSQSENEQNPFRATETASVRQSVEDAGSEFVYTNANSDQAKQLSDIQSMINQGVDALIVAPISATGLQSAFEAAKAKGIPVITIDRETAGQPCTDFISFMGSDFEKQGQRAGEAMIDALGGKGVVAEIQGAPGSDVATLRTKGFAAATKDASGIDVVAQQTGNWATSEAQEVLAQLLSSNPDINAVYTHSDTMALGALTAISQAGLTPGADVTVVSIDGTKDAVKHVASGDIAAIVETNPRFGPAALDLLKDWFAGDPVSQKIIMKDELYTKKNAQDALDSGRAY